MKPPYNWNKTGFMKKRIGIKNLEKDLYQGRFVIHRDSAIDEGVYLGEHAREAIVVDYQKSPKLKELYKKTKQRAAIQGVISEDNVLQAVYDLVTESMPVQDEDAVEELLCKYGVKKDYKISLDVFLEEGVGVCRHDALSCGVLLELFKKERSIEGKISIDRNSIGDMGHAWCRYKKTNGKRYILDVALGYFGTLKDSLTKGKWDYRRPKEKV